MPQGHSVRARMLILEQNKPDVDVRDLSQCQAEASGGQYAMVTAAFVQWLARDYGSILKCLKNEVAELRNSLGEFAHGRTATLAADLLIGLRYFLDFAQQLAGLDAKTAEQLRKDWQEVVIRVAERQSVHQAAVDPVERFFQLLGSAISSGKAYAANKNGKAPNNSGAWGWRSEGSLQYPQGNQIGWLDDDDLYLDTVACLKVVQDISVNGEGVHLTSMTLHKRLSERGRLKSTDPSRDTLTIRKTLQGHRREVIHLPKEVLDGGAGSVLCDEAKPPKWTVGNASFGCFPAINTN